MPITPEYLTYQLDTLKVQKELEETILNDITRRIVKTDFTITETAAWQTEKLQQCGMLYDDIITEISKATGKTKSEIKAIYKDSSTEIFNYENVDTPIGAMMPMSAKMQQIWNASLAKTTTEAINLTKTTAITSQASYIGACDLAHMQVVSGAFTYQQAIKSAINSVINQGVKVVYPSGHISRLDTAVRRSVLTGVNQTAGQLQTMRADEMDNDLMEITAHAGARPDHAEWQGQIVSRKGKRGYLTLNDIGYGRVEGFMGANCRHNWYMYFEGISSPAYTKSQLDEFKNHTVEHDGVKMTDYEASQKQRSLERSVRKQKQKLVCTNTAINETDNELLKTDLQVDFNRQSVKLKERESTLKDFCTQTGRRADTFRTQVYGFDRSVSSKAVWGSKKSVANGGNGGIIKVHRGRQDKHILGANNYQQGKSYLTISNDDIKNIITEKSGTGIRAGNKERIIANKIIGVNVNQKHGYKTLTDKATIHNSKDGCHLVPTVSQLQRKTLPELKDYSKKMAMEYYDTEYYTQFFGKLSPAEKERRIDLLLSGKQSKTALIKDIKSMEKKILKVRGEIK